MTRCTRLLPCAVILAMMCVYLAVARHPGLAENAPPAADLPKTAINPKDGAEMILIPAGEFLMGSADTDKTRSEGEQPQHTVSLDAYYIYKTDVTVAQYRKFCEATGRQMPKPPSFGWTDDYPMIGVRWDDANAYAQWAGAALPTEAQWEKAARGTDGRQYPWGNEWDAAKCRWAKSDATPHPVMAGSIPTDASPYGVLDMAGNMQQWCADWYAKEYYRQSPAQNPTGPEEGTMRVLRGGCWLDSSPVDCRAATRKMASPTQLSGRVSFRCVMLPALLAPEKAEPAPEKAEPAPEKAEPADQMARVQITTEPPGATILMNRTRVGKPSNCTIKTDLGEAATKTVQLTFTLDGYEDEVRTVTLERGKTVTLAVTMQKKAAPVAPAVTTPATTPFTPITTPPVATPPATADNNASGPVNISAELVTARLAEVKDHLFFLEDPDDFETTEEMVQFDSFLLPNGAYAKVHYTWSKLIGENGANILRKPTDKEVEVQGRPSDQYLYYTSKEMRPDYAVGTVELQIPTQFARIAFAANHVNVTREDGPLHVILLACKNDTCTLKVQGKLKLDDLIVIPRDVAGRPLEINGTEQEAIDDETLQIKETVSGTIARVEIYTPLAYVTSTFDIQASAPPFTDGANTNLRASRYARVNHLVQGANFDQAALKAQVSITAQRRTTSELNCPLIQVQLPNALNSAYANVTYGEPELTDKNGNGVTYEPRVNPFNPGTFASEIQFTETNVPFAFATGTVHLHYPAALNVVTLTPAQPAAGGVKAKFNGLKVTVWAQNCPDGPDLPEDLKSVRAYDAAGHQLVLLAYANDGGIIYWGKPAEVRVVTVDKWLDLDLPFHLPPAPVPEE